MKQTLKIFVILLTLIFYGIFSVNIVLAVPSSPDTGDSLVDPDSAEFGDSAFFDNFATSEESATTSTTSAEADITTTTSAYESITTTTTEPLVASTTTGPGDYIIILIIATVFFSILFVDLLIQTYKYKI